MSIFKEIPPTAGLPVYIKDLFRLKPLPGDIENDFRSCLGVDYARITYSGTAAFYLILESLKNRSGKKTVVIPSYICPLVPLAIKRAGLKVEVCDITQDDFNFDFDELEKICSLNDDVLAIVAVHLGGIPVDLDKIKEISGKYSIYIIEDCAQSLGAEYKGRKTGSIGDFSFFSLCRGKGLTIYEGGVIVTRRKEFGEIIDQTIKGLVRNNFLSESLKIIELFGYWIFYRPALFWFIFRLPQVFWNLQGNKFRADIEYFEENFPTHAVSKFRKKSGHLGFARIENEIKMQREKAEYYILGLKGLRGIKIFEGPALAKASYPYLTLIFDDQNKRKIALEKLEKTGLGVSQIYGAGIDRYDYLEGVVPQRKFSNANFIAEREITLSTSKFIHQRDQDKIISIIKQIL